MKDWNQSLLDIFLIRKYMDHVTKFKTPQSTTLKINRTISILCFCLAAHHSTIATEFFITSKHLLILMRNQIVLLDAPASLVVTWVLVIFFQIFSLCSPYSLYLQSPLSSQSPQSLQVLLAHLRVDFQAFFFLQSHWSMSIDTELYYKVFNSQYNH